MADSESSSEHSSSSDGESASVSSRRPEAADAASSSSAVAAPKKVKKVKKVKKKQPPVVISVEATKYAIIRECAREMGWRQAEEGEEWQIYWTDLSVSSERVMKLQSWQKLNHFPSMDQLCRKVPMGRNLNKMRRLYPDDYSFFPQTWTLPGDWNDLRRKFENNHKEKPSRTFIVKPSAGCQGRGIYLAKNIANIDPTEDAIVQEYVKKPFLIDGYKFDLRVYALVTCCDPLRIFLFQEGLVRLCTNKYKAPSSKNLANVFMHLTNYAVNKKNENFEANDDEDDGTEGSKRDFKFLNEYVAAKGHDPVKMWDDISDVIIKCLIGVQPILSHTYHTCLPSTQNDGYSCFEVLGFDILLDKQLVPWLMEVNHSPSFTCDAPIDHRIKHALILETFQMLNLSHGDKLKAKQRDAGGFQKRMFRRGSGKDADSEDPAANDGRVTMEEREAHENATMKLYKRIYPTAETTAKYDQFFNQMTVAAGRFTREDIAKANGAAGSGGEVRLGGSSSVRSVSSSRSSASSSSANKPPLAGAAANKLKAAAGKAAVVSKLGPSAASSSAPGAANQKPPLARTSLPTGGLRNILAGQLGPSSSSAPSSDSISPQDGLPSHRGYSSDGDVWQGKAKQESEAASVQDMYSAFSKFNVADEGLSAMLKDIGAHAAAINSAVGMMRTADSRDFSSTPIPDESSSSASASSPPLQQQQFFSSHPPHPIPHSSSARQQNPMQASMPLAPWDLEASLRMQAMQQQQYQQPPTLKPTAVPMVPFGATKAVSLANLHQQSGSRPSSASRNGVLVRTPRSSSTPRSARSSSGNENMMVPIPTIGLMGKQNSAPSIPAAPLKGNVEILGTKEQILAALTSRSNASDASNNGGRSQRQLVLDRAKYMHPSAAPGGVDGPELQRGRSMEKISAPSTPSAAAISSAPFTVTGSIARANSSSASSRPSSLFIGKKPEEGIAISGAPPAGSGGVRVLASPSRDRRPSSGAAGSRPSSAAIAAVANANAAPKSFLSSVSNRFPLNAR